MSGQRWVSVMFMFMASYICGVKCFLVAPAALTAPSLGACSSQVQLGQSASRSQIFSQIFPCFENRGLLRSNPLFSKTTNEHKVNVLRLRCLDATSSQDVDPDTTAELEQMEELVRSLSKEKNDALRRERVAKMFARELAGVCLGDEPPRFAAAFQVVLEKIGEEVQATAREKLMMAQQQASLAQGWEPKPPAEGEEYVPREKTAEEMQLWACIDMMVQSKLLVSRAINPSSK